MIRVTIEHYPGGKHASKETIGSVEIVNISHLASSSNYSCRVIANGSHELNIPAVNRELVIKGHYREDGILQLLYRVFWQAVHE